MGRFTPSPKQELLAELNSKYAAAGLPKPRFSNASVGDLDFAVERTLEGIFVTLPEIHKMMSR